MSEAIQEEKPKQTDFVLVKIPARHWTYYGKHRLGKQSRKMWMPTSRRANALFNLAVYECNDSKLEKEVQRIFSTNKLQISVIYNQFTYLYCSRVKDVNILVELLDGMEKLFQVGYETGPFKKIMSKNPSANDYWTLIQCIRNETNSRVSKRFMRKFTGAMSETFNNLFEKIKTAEMSSC